MASGLIATKLGLSRMFTQHGRSVAVTVLQAGPCAVTQVKEAKTDGYRAVQIGFEPVQKVSRVTKALQGHFRKAGTDTFRYVREFRVANGEYAVGQQLTVAVFQEGELVDVTGTSIGKGFQGGMKRWHWKGGKATHGSMQHRAPGSIGSTTTPGRVFKGHHLPGHMGNARVTVQNLRIIQIEPQTNLVILEGAVPGPRQRLIMLRKSVKRPGAVVASKGLQEMAVEVEEDTKAKPKKK
jgi:large subunit ribosomal protein L3